MYLAEESKTITSLPKKEVEMTEIKRSPQVWSADGRMAQRCRKDTRDQSGSLVLHAYSTGLHCTG